MSSHGPAAPAGATGARTAAPAHPGLVRWTGILFIAGSALFAAGVPAGWLTPPVLYGAIFFAGSVCFTSAAALQLLTATGRVARPLRRAWPPAPRRWLPHPRHLDRISAATQLAGTLLFNVNTWRAWQWTGLSTAAADERIWRPDAVGSILFLVSSGLACLPEIRGRRHGHVPTRSRRIAGLNLAGSLLFGVSAVGAYVVPDTGDPVSDAWADAGTFLGALCFLAGAALLLPGRPPRVERAAQAAGSGAVR